MHLCGNSWNLTGIVVRYLPFGYFFAKHCTVCILFAVLNDLRWSQQQSAVWNALVMKVVGGFFPSYTNFSPGLIYRYFFISN